MTQEASTQVVTRLYEQLLDRMPVMLWTANAQGIWKHVNEAWTAYTGLSGEVSGFGFEEAVHPDDRPGVLRVWQASVESRRPYEIEYRLRRTDGLYHWFLIRGTPVPGEADITVAWVGTCTDIEAQKQAEQAAMTAQEAAVRALGLAMEVRDLETQGHTDRVTRQALRLGHRLGLDAEALGALRLGAYLHDVGKLGVPDAILLKPGPLTGAEWTQMREHVTQGRGFAAELGFLPEGALALIEQHHEHWDGHGYPLGRVGTDIHPLARLFSVVDVYDALVSERPYKAAWPRAEAVAELKRQRGHQFDPEVVDAFLAVLPDS